MKKRFAFAALLLVITAFALTAGVFAQDVQPTDVVVVNGEAITGPEFYQALERESGVKVLQQLIVEKLLLQEAEKLGIAPTKDFIDIQVQNVKARFGDDEATFQRALAEYGLDMERLRVELALSEIIRYLSRQGVTVSDEEVKASFEQNKENMTEVHARHILVETEQEALDIKAKLDAGEKFEDLAKAHSKDGSAANGGDLGFFGKGRMVQPFENAAFSTNPGEVAGPVQTQFGYHLIKVEERKEPSFAEAAPMLKEQLMQQKSRSQEEIINGLLENAKIDAVWPEYSILEDMPEAVKANPAQ